MQVSFDLYTSLLLFSSHLYRSFWSSYMQVSFDPHTSLWQVSFVGLFCRSFLIFVRLLCTSLFKVSFAGLCWFKCRSLLIHKRLFGVRLFDFLRSLLRVCFEGLSVRFLGIYMQAFFDLCKSLSKVFFQGFFRVCLLKGLFYRSPGIYMQVSFDLFSSLLLFSSHLYRSFLIYVRLFCRSLFKVSFAGLFWFVSRYLLIYVRLFCVFFTKVSFVGFFWLYASFFDLCSSLLQVYFDLYAGLFWFIYVSLVFCFWKVSFVGPFWLCASFFWSIYGSFAGLFWFI